MLGAVFCGFGVGFVFFQTRGDDHLGDLVVVVGTMPVLVIMPQAESVYSRNGDSRHELMAVDRKSYLRLITGTRRRSAGCRPQCDARNFRVHQTITATFLVIQRLL